MKHYLLTALVAIAAFSSCKKETPQQSKTAFNAAAVAKGGVDDCANPQNPYDVAGYNHNMCLQATRSVWSAPNATAQDIHQAVSDYNMTHFQNPLTAAEIQIADDVYADNINDFANIISNSALSPHGKDMATQMISLTSNLSTTVTYTDYKSIVVNFEARLMADNNLTDEDKETLLKSTSVARYSMCYWLNEEAGSNPPGSNPVQCRNIFQKIRDAWNAAVDRLDRADLSTYLHGGDEGAVADASLHAFFHP